MNQLDFRTLLVENFFIDTFSSRKHIRHPTLRHIAEDNGPHKIEDLRNYGVGASKRCRVCLDSGTRHETYYGCHMCGNVPLCSPSVFYSFPQPMNYVHVTNTEYSVAIFAMPALLY